MNTIDWKVVADAELHELRIRILEAAAAEAEVSPLKLAEDLGQPLGNVSYHVRALVDRGLLEPTRTEPRRGALAHFYRLADSARAIVIDKELVAA